VPHIVPSLLHAHQNRVGGQGARAAFAPFEGTNRPFGAPMDIKGRSASRLKAPKAWLSCAARARATAILVAG